MNDDGYVVHHVRSYDDTYVLQIGGGRLFITSFVAEIGRVSNQDYDYLHYAELSAEVASPAPPTPVIDVTGDYSFGSIRTGTARDHTFIIENLGTATLNVTGITYPAGFSGNWNSGTIAPGQSQSVTVTFIPMAPSSHVGPMIVSSNATFGVTAPDLTGLGLPDGGGADGIDWTLRPVSDGGRGSLRDVLWTGNQFVAAGYIDGALTSFDGENWTVHPAPNFGTRFLLWNGNQFVAEAQGLTEPSGASAYGILTSTDAVAWTPRLLSATPRDVAWDGNRFVGISWGMVHASADSITWTTSADLRQTVADLFSINWTGDQFVVTGENGVVMTSLDAANWTISATGTAQDLNDATATESTIVVVGNGGTILTSTNGSTWTSRNSGTSQDLHGVTWTGDLLVAVGAGGTILTSADGITWTARNSGTSARLNNIAWNATRFVAVGEDGVILTNGAAGATPDAPVITQQPTDVAVLAGGPAFFSVAVSGPAAVTYAWQRSTDAGANWTTLGDNGGFTGSASATLVVAPSAQVDGHRFRVHVSNAGGAVSSNSAALKVLQEPTARLPNLSVRTTLAANQVLTVGFVMTGGAKPLLMRAIGPQLAEFGLAGAMPDPSIGFYNSGGVQTAANDDWSQADAALFGELGAFPLDAGSKDAVLRVDLNGPSTARVSGPQAGTVLVEVYDIGNSNTRRLANVSARNRVGTGSDILIAGFVVQGADPKTMLIRAVGPTLGDFGVPGVLADPKLEILTGAGAPVATNDNWNSSLVPAFEIAGAFALPQQSRDAALIVTLPPGTYTAQVSGADGGTGEALVEVYELP